MSSVRECWNDVEDRVVFLKLGGSLVTDKTGTEALRADVLRRIAREIRETISALPNRKLIIGHGSGSFGHTAAAKYGTMEGVSTRAQWRGFCEVSDAASRLNRLVTGALLEAGVPAVSLQPSASAICSGGKLITLTSEPIKAALAAGIVPVIHGDVAFDTKLGGTITSTEDIFSFLAQELHPDWLLLAGETEGVLGEGGEVITNITKANFSSVERLLGGSRGTDITGGMESKVRGMLALVESLPATRVRIFSGLHPGQVHGALMAGIHPAGDSLSGARDTSVLVEIDAGGTVVAAVEATPGTSLYRTL